MAKVGKIILQYTCMCPQMITTTEISIIEMVPTCYNERQ